MPYSSPKSHRIPFLLSLGICSLLLGPAVQGEEPPEKARALLDQVQKSEQDRQVAAKQTEIERLKEDQTKIETDSNGLKQTLDSTSGLVTETTDHLTALTTDSRRLQHELAISEAWTNAEQAKIAGLHAMTDAQGKSLSALARRAEATDARSHLLAVEMQILQDGKQVPGEGRDNSQPDLMKARKALAVAEAKLESEERLAHEAMKAATAKMALAGTKADTAQRLADNDLTLEPPAAPKPKSKTAAKSAEKLAPVAAPPPKTATPAKSAPNTAGKNKKAPATPHP